MIYINNVPHFAKNNYRKMHGKPIIRNRTLQNYILRNYKIRKIQLSSVYGDMKK